MVPVPLFPGIPGGPELLIILLVVVILGIPLSAVVLIGLGVTKLRSNEQDREERIAELEREVDRLRDESDGRPDGTRAGDEIAGERASGDVPDEWTDRDE
jgi:sec-independent protein translocase protein TatA